MSEVLTRWHDFLTAYHNNDTLTGLFQGRMSRVVGDEQFDKNKFEELAGMLTDIPHYVFTKETVEIIRSAQTDKSLEALVTMDQDKLPFIAQLAEFDGPSGPTGSTRFFVILTERESKLMRPGEFPYHPFVCTVMSLYTAKGGKHHGHSFACIYPFQLLARLQRIGAPDDYGKPHKVVSMHYMMVDAPWYTSTTDDYIAESLATESLKEQAATAVRGLIMMMHMRGIEREIVSVPKLNKKRQANHKPIIRDHTVVRLGYYMTSTGEKKRYDPSKNKGLRGMWIMPTHYRNQRFGPKLIYTKRIKIDGWIANFDPSKPAPVPKLKVVKP